MTRRMIVGIGVLACVLLPARADAQTVLFRIVDDETSAAVFGAIVVVSMVDGERAADVLTIPEDPLGAPLEIRRR